MSLLSGTRIGPYEVAALIGEGGMGQVYRARDTKLQRDVALKVLPAAFANDPERLARFEREARLLASLNHPNIATIHGLESGGDAGLTLVMEFVEGPTLADMLWDSGTPKALSTPDTLAIARQVAEALEAAHEQGIVHRDLKPANIKVRPDGTVKVLDFGLAKLSGPSSAAALRDDVASPTITSPAMTKAGVILGTAAYMSPEQARGREADARSDVFAFGCVLYEMLSGRRAFAGGDISETLAFVITRDPDWTNLPPEIPPPLKTLLARCLVKDRRKRLQAIAEARITIDELTSGAGVSAAAATPVAPTPGRRPHRWWPWAAAGIVASAGIATLSLMPVDRRPEGLEIPLARFTLDTPPDVQFMTIGSGQMVNFALSPDGSSLAFVGQDRDDTRLWLRPLGSLGARALPGTEGAIGTPFWSPDGRAVAFFTTDRLRVADLANGTARTVCAIPPVLLGSFASGAWSGAGTIVFSVHTDTPLSAVPATGGTPTALQLFAGRHEGVRIARPQFLPDQQRFLFAARSAAAESTGVFMASLTNLQPVRVLDREAIAAYALGHVLFVRDGVLMAQRFDTAQATLVDAPRPLGEDTEFLNDTAGHLTAAGPLLVYSTGAPPRTELIAVDRTGRRLDTVVGPERRFNFELSPDGKRVVMSRPNAQARSSDLWMIDLARRMETRLTFGQGTANSPVWSPDGRTIAFNRNTPGPPAVWIVPADGGPERRLRTFENAINLDDWSPDGKFITFNLSPRLMAFAASGESAPFPFVETGRASLDESHFSPDGKWIAYNSDESGTWQVYVSPFPTTGQRWQISSDGGVEPRWRGDGRELFYRTLSGVIMAVSVTPRLPFEAGTPAVLFRADLVPNPHTDEYAVMADGQRFLLKSIPKGERLALTAVINWAR